METLQTIFIVQKIPEVQLEWERIPVLSAAIRSVSQLTYLHINFALCIRTASLRAQEQSFSKVEHMNISICSYRACNTELKVLQNSIKSMKWAVISAKESRYKNFYRFQRHSMPQVTYVPSILNLADSPSRLTEKMGCNQKGAPEENNNKNNNANVEDCNGLSDLLELSIQQPLLLQATTVIWDTKSGKSPFLKNKHWRLIVSERFLQWKQSKNLIDLISVAQIVNHLAEIYFIDELNSSTIKAYKFAILGLKSSIRSFIKPSINIGPILVTFSNWSINSEISIKNLTSKLRWLLAVTGISRFSNVHRIDDARKYITDDTFHLVIITLKEKRRGQPVERPCQIAEHSKPIMCPVMAYREYKYRVATTPCINPHINNSSWMVNRLLHQVNRHKKPLSMISITRYTHNLLDLITRPKDTPIPKTRVIGANLAAQAGASAKDIVNHEFWFNYSIFILIIDSLEIYKTI
ncbi:hypothetical protein BB561_003468 [Smittium simulii]|uniref:Uncharacterized protein n=1 Tax=Smittium simulii TaxID=133385 RepID=A0A2T9YL74_9FUNG|nr:hypothetical protein BB561_003468 [Smittium simulii]